MTLSELERRCATMRSVVGDVDVVVERYGGFSLQRDFVSPVTRVDAIPHNKTVVAVIV